jgi:hypothetical protein
MPEGTRSIRISLVWARWISEAHKVGKTGQAG